ncbi:unnamed protein product, partial [Ectocarpus fasciculatus]
AEWRALFQPEVRATGGERGGGQRAELTRSASRFTSFPQRPQEEAAVVCLRSCTRGKWRGNSSSPEGATSKAGLSSVTSTVAPYRIAGRWIRRNARGEEARNCSQVVPAAACWRRAVPAGAAARRPVCCKTRPSRPWMGAAEPESSSARSARTQAAATLPPPPRPRPLPTAACSRHGEVVRRPWEFDRQR